MTVCQAGQETAFAGNSTADRECTDCQLGVTYSLDGVTCKSVSTCDALEQEALAPTTSSDRTCECQPTAFFDQAVAICSPCTQSCPSHNYIFRTCLSTSNVDCRPITICEAGFEEVVAPTESSDRECQACKLGFFKPNRDTYNSTTPCKLTSSCQPVVEFEAASATTTSDTLCAPVASADMYFDPPVAVDEDKLNELEQTIIAALANQTTLKPEDVLEIILEVTRAGRRRTTATIVPSAEATFRSVANAQLMSDWVAARASFLFNNRTYTTSSEPMTTTTAPKPTEQAASSGSASNNGTIGAGVGAGVGILLVAVLAVVYFRRRDAHKRKAAETRQVVSFNNPTYEDTDTFDNKQNPVYENDDNGDMEGLYDDPQTFHDAGIDGDYLEAPANLNHDDVGYLKAGSDDEHGFGGFDDHDADNEDESGYLDVQEAAMGFD
eukprot:TRINITY_DN12631_c1_g3_i3.p1 TRINITY_DN12631_c1_g3~~TRINITY_DN12631_c1_g3_i3.p1  ORF type:complete len:438 (+),score=94.38 TRINITY_DN12631_c1_g3_i3:2107-3420(+)